ncbi:MAG: alpha/beta hydrolase [Synechococcales cyanobacterium RU_4_20]|nr:alpha/beta hydrolase [Synechococcales cyanobacterium RU_4_20]
MINQWQYTQEPDESCSLERVLTLLHDYLKHRSRPVHLMGHGVSGAIALLYTRLHPKRVRSLTLFAVAEQPAVTWHANYYVQRHLSPCSQHRLLAQIAQQLFKGKLLYSSHQLIQVLAKDLREAPLLHSLCHIEKLPQGGVEVPLMVYGAADDMIVRDAALRDWREHLNKGDRIWSCEQGGHFFHYFQAKALADQVNSFWQSLAQPRLVATERFYSNPA